MEIISISASASVSQQQHIPVSASILEDTYSIGSHSQCTHRHMAAFPSVGLCAPRVCHHVVMGHALSTSGTLVYFYLIIIIYKCVWHVKCFCVCATCKVERCWNVLQDDFATRLQSLTLRINTSIIMSSILHSRATLCFKPVQHTEHVRLSVPVHLSRTLSTHDMLMWIHVLHMCDAAPRSSNQGDYLRVWYHPWNWGDRYAGQYDLQGLWWSFYHVSCRFASGDCRKGSNTVTHWMTVLWTLVRLECEISELPSNFSCTIWNQGRVVLMVWIHTDSHLGDVQSTVSAAKLVHWWFVAIDILLPGFCVRTWVTCSDHCLRFPDIYAEVHIYIHVRLPACLNPKHKVNMSRARLRMFNMTLVSQTCMTLSLTVSVSEQAEIMIFWARYPPRYDPQTAW